MFADLEAGGMDIPITEADIFEEKEELMVSLSGGMPCKRIAKFLKPVISEPQDSKLNFPFITSKPKWAIDVAFKGWLQPLRKWSRWVDQMHSEHSDLWRKAGILEAILASKYKFLRVDDLFYGVAERWNTDTNTFFFPWGEVTITLEDMMILGGFSVLGAPVFSPPKDRNVEEICMNLTEVLLTKRTQNHIEWLSFYMKSGQKYEHEAFLSLWLSMFVFPGTEVDRVRHEVFPIAVNLARGTKFALAPAVLASIYRDLGVLRATMTASTEHELGKRCLLAVSLCAPLQLVQLWAWERSFPFTPAPKFLKQGEPRVARWHNLTRSGIRNVRQTISSPGNIFSWRPYCLPIDDWPLPNFYNVKQEWTPIGAGQDLGEELESFVRCLRSCVLVGLGCQEPYNPNRVGMQFGFNQDIPECIPRTNANAELAWCDYSRRFSIEAKLELPPWLADLEVSIRYVDWWRKDVFVSPLEFQVLPRKKRRLRQSRTHIPYEQDIQMDCPVSNDENLGCSSDAMVLHEPSPLSSHSQIELHQEDMNILTNSPFTAPADLDVPPAFSPQANVTEETTEVLSSNVQTTEILQAEEKESSDIDCEATSALPTSRVGASGSLQESSNSGCQSGLQGLMELEDRMKRLEAFLSEQQKRKDLRY